MVGVVSDDKLIIILLAFAETLGTTALLPFEAARIRTVADPGQAVPDIRSCNNAFDAYKLRINPDGMWPEWYCTS